MKRKKLALTIAAMAIILGGSFSESINMGSINTTVYADECTKCPLMHLGLEQPEYLREGEEIKVKVTMGAKGWNINGVCMHIGYDTSVFDVLKIEAGEICVNSKKTFSARARNGKIDFFFADSTGEDLELINEDGNFAIITLRVKQGYREGDRKLHCMDVLANDIYDRDIEFDIKKEPNFKPKLKNVNVAVEENNKDTSNTINPTFKITNNNGEKINLSDLKINYYYTKDSTPDITEAFNCYYAGTTNKEYKSLTSNVVGKLIPLNDYEKTDNADSCMEISFNEGTLEAGQSMTVQTAVNKSDWSSYDLKNDHSFKDNDNICTYMNGELVNGETPKTAAEKNKPVNVSIVSEGKIEEDNVICVTVNLDNVSGRELSEIDLALMYNNHLFEVVDIMRGQIIGNPIYPFQTDEDPGLITMNFEKSVTQSGTFAEIYLKVKDIYYNTDETFK